ncbi:MAG: alpha/beta hydrolase [Haliea sp.]
MSEKPIIEQDRYFTFAAKDSTTCLVFYPGGLVQPLAYAPLMQKLADAGFTAYLLKVPMSLAVLDANAADAILEDDSNRCRHYVISGHSLGGVMAARYVLHKPDYGLILLAAYPQASKSLAQHPAPVLSITASLDGLSTPEKVTARDYLLPGHARRLTIEGGNHAQFGWYGAQRGDNPAVLSRTEQQTIILNAMLQFLRDFNGS